MDLGFVTSMSFICRASDFNFGFNGHVNIVNGYDNSGLNQSNQNLSDTLNKYQEEEDKLLADTKDKIEDFEFQNPFDTFVAPLEDVAYFLNGIYMTLGSFNIPIGFSLTLTIALLCIAGIASGEVVKCSRSLIL